MKKEAYEILKRSLTEHRELVLSGKQPCLAIMRDYGGRDHQEINLFAEALAERIPDRLMSSQPVTDDTIASLSHKFSEKTFYAPEISDFVVRSWADALGLITINPSIFTNRVASSDQGNPTSSKDSTVKVDDWYYISGGQQIGPIAESTMISLILTNRIDGETLVWCGRFTEWRPVRSAGPAFSAALNTNTSAPIDVGYIASTADTYISSGPQVRPWVRFFARWSDLMLFSMLAGVFFSMLYAPLLDMPDMLFGIIALFLYVFVEPVMLEKWGATPFKALLNVRVRKMDGRRLSYPETLRRMLKIWVIGLGLGLPLISLITNAMCYDRLKKKSITSWDEDDNLAVSHQTINFWRYAGIVVFWAVVLFFISVAESNK